MNHDTFSAGVEPGGLYSPQQIKILFVTCWTASGSPCPANRYWISLLKRRYGQFFETGAAIDELVRLQNLEGGCRRPSVVKRKGRQAASTLFGSIPYTLRERSVKAASICSRAFGGNGKTASRWKKLPNGYNVICTIHDAEEPLLSLTLRVADEPQAQLIREEFLNDPVLLYRSVLAILTGDAGLRREIGK